MSTPTPDEELRHLVHQHQAQQRADHAANEAAEQQNLRYYHQLYNHLLHWGLWARSKYEEADIEGRQHGRIRWYWPSKRAWAFCGWTYSEPSWDGPTDVDAKLWITSDDRVMVSHAFSVQPWNELDLCHISSGASTWQQPDYEPRVVQFVAERLAKGQSH